MGDGRVLVLIYSRLAQITYDYRAQQQLSFEAYFQRNVFVCIDVYLNKYIFIAVIILQSHYDKQFITSYLFLMLI